MPAAAPPSVSMSAPTASMSISPVPLCQPKTPSDNLPAVTMEPPVTSMSMSPVPA